MLGYSGAAFVVRAVGSMGIPVVDVHEEIFMIMDAVSNPFGYPGIKPELNHHAL